MTLSEERAALPLVSVIIPCRNESQYIVSCLRSLVEGQYPPEQLEIIVVDGMSSDNTRALAEEYGARSHANIRVIENIGISMPRGANLGLQRANGDILFVLNAHSHYSPDYVAVCVKAIRDGVVDCVGGVIRYSDNSGSLWSPAIRLAQSHPFGVGNATHKTKHVSEMFLSDSAGFPAAHRDVWEKAGLYHEALKHSQDFDLFSRMRAAGIRIAVHPAAVATYHARDSLGAFIRYVWRNGVWITLPMRLTSSRFALRHFVPAAAVGIASSLLVTSLWWLPALWFLAGLSSMYALIAAGIAIRVALQKRRLTMLITVPAALFLQHTIMGVGTWWGLIVPIDAEARRAGRTRPPMLTPRNLTPHD